MKRPFPPLFPEESDGLVKFTARPGVSGYEVTAKIEIKSELFITDAQLEGLDYQGIARALKVKMAQQIQDIKTRLYGGIVARLRRIIEAGREGREILEEVRDLYSRMACVDLSQPPARLKGVSPVYTEACWSCRDFHGRTYNGRQLCCGIHPYGPKDKTYCPDRRAVDA